MKNPSRPDQRRLPVSEDSASGTRAAPQLETLGRYQLTSQIASGGMATVFLAMMEGPGGFEKVVALKRIHPHLAEEPDFVDMFLDEARIASRIHHSNVCQVFDFGEADGTFYIAMEFLLGESLARIMKTVRKSQSEYDNPAHIMLGVKVVADACEGLHAAHELKGRDGKDLDVVHRDVSPQNLFVTYDGNVKVVDFGIASASDRVHHTAAGQVKGKFSYMAPEQSRGKKIDRRADVWALGVVLWELLTLRRLFRRETTVETLTAMLNDDVPPPSTYNPNVPPELDRICRRALERDRDQRYASARDFGRDLVRFAGSTGQPAGMVDLAEWMDRLFPEGRDKALGRMEAARRGELDVATVTPGHAELSESEIQEVDVERLRQVHDTRPEIVAPPDDENLPTVTMDTGPFAAQAEPVPPPSQAAAPKGLLIGLAGLVVLLLFIIAGGGLTWLISGEEPVVTQLPPRAEGPEEPPPEGEGAGPTEPVPVEPPVVAVEEPEPPVEEPVVVVEEPETPRVRTPRRPRTTMRTQMTMRTEATQMVVAPTPMTTQMSDEPAEPGRVVIFTPGGWANVYDESGRFLGQSPTTVTLPAGTHRLQLRPFGQPPARRVRVNVPAGGTTRVVQTVGGD